MPNNIIDHSSSDIEVIYEPDRVINVLAELISEANVRLDYCLDSMGLSYFMYCEPIWNAIIRLKNRDITPRLVTEITPKNVRDCNLNMKHNDVFHSDRIKGNFLIVDGIKYLCCFMGEGAFEGKQYVHQILYTEFKTFVDTHQYLFDTIFAVILFLPKKR